MRSIGSPNPKEAGQQAVAVYTAEAGPEGPKLRSKYMNHSGKNFGRKTGGNSGSAGRRYRIKVRQGGYTTRSSSPAGRVSKK